MRCMCKNMRKATIVYQMGKQVMVPYVEDNLKFVFWLLIDTLMKSLQEPQNRISIGSSW